ncbi:hypothetical protein RVS70_05870 [Virgibacillus sp. M23]|uniref:hypothetical protein n=1 Tax=Virgibacillus sp. M23 TaxID=3079030 RepID=UPI002A912D3E|nr:hypothetical protein [Virgibacillus sp. M23]MDY7043729.1 hypothetical protein [Virgibacillus sp. M23]
MKIPVILNEQQPIMDWAISKLNHFMGLSSIIELLVSDKVSKYHRQDEELMQARKIYCKYNSSHKDNILQSIMIKAYRKETDFSEGQIVTNGSLVGFARDLDYGKREFFLYSSIDNCSRIGNFKIDDFSRIIK